MHIDDLARQLRAITPVDQREEDSIRQTLERLAWPGDPYSESENSHHLTASSFVVSSRGVILHLHRRLGIWVQPGGHVDAGETPDRAAVRETVEETGLTVKLVDPPSVFHVDVHPGPRGHTHYDLRFVMTSAPIEPSPPEGESPEVYWFDFDSALERCEPGLRAALVKLRTYAATLEMRE